MRFRKAVLTVLTACATYVVASGHSEMGAVHEWGTFTSVAGNDGSAMSWEPLSGPSDLPCFVHRLDQRDLKAAEYGTVRMETPVLYFYPLKPLTVSVHVDFPRGRVTEWFPQASGVQPSVSRRGWVEWNDVQVGNIGTPLPALGPASHYYAARATDAWELRSGHENEKLLFYRGIADFGIDLKAVVHDDGVSLINDGTDTIPEAILFQNHAGQIGYHIVHAVRGPTNINFSSLSGTLDSLRRDLEDELVEMGLYPKEAHAMVETWRDSWFEEGLRVFYIVPRSKVDALLPITVHPAPAQLARVFVGRVELLSPLMRQELSAALMNGDVQPLTKCGRFLNAFLREMGNGDHDPPMSEPAHQFLLRSYSRAFAESRTLACASAPEH